MHIHHTFVFTYLQVYSQLNHINACISYPATLRLVEDVSKLHSIPLEQWIAEGIVSSSSLGIMLTKRWVYVMYE